MDNNISHEIKILYGSQTGTAKFASEELEREFLKFDYKVIALPLDEYSFSQIINDSFIIFIVSTTGYGEPPDNMKKFWNFIMSKDNNLDLIGLNYTIFGLGDSSYERFNWVAKLLNNRLKKLCANLFHPLGLGDEQHDFGYEGEFDPWLDSVLQKLGQDYFKSKYKIYPSLSFIPSYNVVILNSDLTNVQDNYDKLSSFSLHKGNIINYNLLTELERKVKIIEISTEDNLIYETGDIAVIYPSNDNDSIEQLLKLYNMSQNTLLKISLKSESKLIKSEYPEIISLKELFKKWLNINGLPNRFFCMVASEYTENEIHKEKLKLFYSKTSVSLP